MEFNTIISGLNFPEGPVFDFDGNLWFVEIKGGNLSRWDGSALTRFPVDGTPNGVLFSKDGILWFCDSGRGEIRMFDPQTKAFKTICNSTEDGRPLVRPNDLIFDSAGNLLFSDHADGRESPVSMIYVLPKGSDQARVISFGKYFTNGLALASDSKTLIFAETYRQQLWTAQWDPEQLQLSGERHFAKAGNGPWGPDGMAFDIHENLFVAIFNESRLNVYSKDGGLIRTLPCSGKRPTSCAFDPLGRLGLVVTEADRGEIISYPDAGTGLPIYYG
ncbi:MAG: SMP-30/gluconolactonase/LRE family protein [Mangrovibacterium sp.]